MEITIQESATLQMTLQNACHFKRYEELISGLKNREKIHENMK